MTPTDKQLLGGIIRLAHQNPKIRPHLLPLIKEAATQVESGETDRQVYSILLPVQEALTKAVKDLASVKDNSFNDIKGDLKKVSDKVDKEVRNLASDWGL